MRAVLDVNVLISASFAAEGACSSALLARWLAGEFELVASEVLLDELRRALAYPKLRSRISGGQAEAFVDLLRRGTTVAASRDTPPPRRSRDPGDDYLVALAAATDSILVTWDGDLLALGELPVESPPAFLARLRAIDAARQ